MELRSVEELMDLLYACRGARDVPVPGGAPVDAYDHALRTAALLRRRRPADKELQAAGLVLPVGRLLQPGGPSDRAADAVRALLGGRVAELVRHRPRHGLRGEEDDLLALRTADEEARTACFDAGVLEDWRTVLELLAARTSRLGAVD
ncbi:MULTISPECIES: hypothetical protein [unclassified Streptomyces]|uniref:hypothetical protein n=1 Tax=unclassified Streptomyces TaxID=2593676 RepID=UPI0005AA9D2D|nr:MULTISPECIES: hypothetical protein [unclassified Streptomyces]ODA73607.1 hypothetical protein APS67_002187 [Streptomyces sp. AVP053U2]